MARTLVEALERNPLFFEPVPLAGRARPERGRAYMDELVGRLTAVDRLDAIDVPELVDENHEGRPYYRSLDPRAFAESLLARTARPVVLNKVVAHLASPEALESWARETVARGLTNLVLVGGSSRYIPYPGPAVTEANRICRGIVSPLGGLLGNIAIPQRTGEAHRMLSKTRAGARFFTTQILFDSEQVLALLRGYGALCLQAGVPPASLLVSVVPLADEGDAEFVRWLGADIPEPAEQAILNGDESGATARSVDHAVRLWEEIRDGAARAENAVPLGVNVEQISARHLPAAAEMLEAFARVIDAPAGR